MSTKASKRVSFSPDAPTVFLKQAGGARSSLGANRKRVAGIFSFKLLRSSKLSAARLLRGIGAKVVKVLRFESMRRKSSRRVSSSSSSSSSASLTRSRSLADAAIDSQRAEAIEDCIEFLNSSSSLQRSNSVSTNSC